MRPRQLSLQCALYVCKPGDPGKVLSSPGCPAYRAAAAATRPGSPLWVPIFLLCWMLALVVVSFQCRHTLGQCNSWAVVEFLTSMCISYLWFVDMVTNAQVLAKRTGLTTNV
jgi:hypothetical protein